MTVSNPGDVSLYWISGSPPAWRVMLSLLLKGVNYKSHLLEHSKGENKTPEYLAINPKGEVPTLVHNGLIVRESVAIIAYIDKAFEGPALFGKTPAEFAAVWQRIMDFESNFRPAVGSIANIMLRNQLRERAGELEQAESSMRWQLFELDALLEHSPWICGEHVSAAECWFYPSIAWVERTAKVSKADAPSTLSHPLEGFENLMEWRTRFEMTEGFSRTIPPHWSKG